MRKMYLILAISFLFFKMNAQSHSENCCIGHKIDSIAKANNITKGYFIGSGIGTSGGKEFKIDGSFLVINDVYYNLNRLRYFFIDENKRKKRKKIAFCF